MQKNRLFLYYLSLLLLLAILLAVVACEQDEGGVSPQKTPSGRVVSGRNSNLTADAAQAWYEANYFPVVSFAPPQTRSGSDGSDVLIKPMWEATKEYKKGKYELVEMPMLTKAPVLFMDEQTAKVVEQNPEGLKLRNTAKLVIRKNLETGKTESFVMIFVASLKYATEHYKDMGKLSYFKRPADYDGMVLFFELEKGFVNGWRYEEGKITKTIRPSAGTGSPNAPLTRGYYDEVCEAVYTYYSYWELAPEPGEERIWDEELGAWELSAVNAWSLVEGYDVSWQCDYEWVPEPGDDEEEDQDDDDYYYYDLGGYTGGTDNTPKPDPVVTSPRQPTPTVSVPNGFCVPGSIAAAIEVATGVDWQTAYNKAEAALKGAGVTMVVGYGGGVNASEKQIKQALTSLGFTVSGARYEADYLTTYFQLGGYGIGHFVGSSVSHDVLLTGYDAQSNTYEYYDSVRGRSYQGRPDGIILFSK